MPVEAARPAGATGRCARAPMDSSSPAAGTTATNGDYFVLTPLRGAGAKGAIGKTSLVVVQATSSRGSDTDHR